MGRIVVGVDGSAPARRALRWALQEAQYRGAEIDAIYVYEHTPSWQLYAYAEGVALAATAPPVDDAGEQAEEEAALQRAQGLVDAEVAAARAEAGAAADSVVVHAVAYQDRRPAHALVARSADADLLVVGSRGRGGFSELLLGSVSNQCTHHASCPVVVVRAPAGDEQGDG